MRQAACYGYYRVSAVEQVDGFSPEGQQRLIRDYHKRISTLPPLAEPMFGDLGESAYKVPFGMRPASSALLKHMKPGDHVIFAFHDRAFRNMLDFAQTMDRWQKQSVTVHFQNLGFDSSSPMGRLMLSILIGFAEFEPQMLSQRMKMMYLQKMRTGVPWTHIGARKGGAFKTPLGFKEVETKHGIRWRVNWPELIGLYRIVQLKELGLSWKEICRSIRVECRGIPELKRLRERMGMQFAISFYKTVWPGWQKQPFYRDLAAYMIAGQGDRPTVQEGDDDDFTREV